MDEKLVSVIISAYNAERYIRQCLDSIIEQTYKNWEVWICDDCSSDNTLAIAKEYENDYDNIHVLFNERNYRAGFSRNRCIKACNGYYIAIQDADDVSEKNRLEVLVREIEENHCDFVSSGYYKFDKNGKYENVVPSISSPKKNDFLYNIPFCHAATLFSKKCLLDVGGYRVSKETRRGQDYDMFMRLYAANYRGINVPDVLYGYRVDNETISRRKLKYRIDECKIRYRGFKSLGLLPCGWLYVFKPIPAHYLQLIRSFFVRIQKQNH